jgi:ATP-binding cassette subfamily F protein 3
VQFGRREVGTRVTFDHFAQDAADQLPGKATILERANELAPTEFVPQVRGLLGAFLFSGDTVHKRISVLSGGERNRLALAFMLMQPANLLLLDEPTNHLDMAAKDVLLAALREFDGTVVFVSHDRYFLAELATRVLEVGHGGIYDYPGGYEGFLYQKSLADERLRSGAPDGGTGGRNESGAASRKEAAAPAGPARKPSAARKLRELEKEIHRLEERKRRLEIALADGEIYRDPEKSSFYLGEYDEVSRELEDSLERWGKLSEAQE